MVVGGGKGEGEVGEGGRGGRSGGGKGGSWEGEVFISQRYTHVDFVVSVSVLFEGVGHQVIHSIGGQQP